MMALFIWLWTSTALNSAVSRFGMGTVFSLVGEGSLMPSLDRFFLAGLAAFLCAHLSDTAGFNTSMTGISGWGLMPAVMIGPGGAHLIRRILETLDSKGQARLRIPIIIYGAVLTLMLFSAMMKLTDVSWNTGADAWVSIGAILFYASDFIPAWNRIISPIHNGRIDNSCAYHLGQIALIAGVVLQSSPSKQNNLF